MARAQWEGVAEGVTADQLANPVLEAVDEGADEEDAEGAVKRAVVTLRRLLEVGPAASKTAERSVIDEAGCSQASVRRLVRRSIGKRVLIPRRKLCRTLPHSSRGVGSPDGGTRPSADLAPLELTGRARGLCMV